MMMLLVWTSVPVPLSLRPPDIKREVSTLKNLLSFSVQKRLATEIRWKLGLVRYLVINRSDQFEPHRLDGATSMSL
jgi:hypothetical protein